MTRSMSAGDRPLPASALPPATTAMSVTLSSGPAIRRLTMPTRLRIHSSVVSTWAARSSLVTTWPGWWPPKDKIRAPAAGGNGVKDRTGAKGDVMRLPFCPGGPIPRTPLGLNTDKWLTLADRIPVFHQPFDDLRRPRCRDRALAAARDDHAEVGGEGDHGPGRGRVAASRGDRNVPDVGATISRHSGRWPWLWRSESARCSAMSSRAASSWSGVLIASCATPGSARRARPVRVPAGGSSMIAVTPRSAMVRMHRSQRTGAATWAMMRSSHSLPVVTAAPSASDSSVIAGSLTGTLAAASRSAATAGAMCRVWKAPATCSGRSRAPAGGAAAKASRSASVPAATICPAPLTLAGVRPLLRDGREHRLRLAAEYGRHPGRLDRRCRRHGRPAHPDQAHRVVRGRARRR